MVFYVFKRRVYRGFLEDQLDVYIKGMTLKGKIVLIYFPSTNLIGQKALADTSTL